MSREVIIKKNINYICCSKRQKPQSGWENVSRGFIEVPVLGFLFYPGGTKVSRVVKKKKKNTCMFVCNKSHSCEKPVCDMHVIVLTMLVRLEGNLHGWTGNDLTLATQSLLTAQAPHQQHPDWELYPCFMVKPHHW